MARRMSSPPRLEYPTQQETPPEGEGLSCLCGAKIPKKEEQEMKGVITEIERFSLKDGPGIRTTVFSKDVIWRANGAIIRKLSLSSRS